MGRLFISGIYGMCEVSYTLMFIYVNVILRFARVLNWNLSFNESFWWFMKTIRLLAMTTELSGDLWLVG